MTGSGTKIYATQIILTMVLSTIIANFQAKDTLANPLDGWPKQLDSISPSFLQLRGDNMTALDCGTSNLDKKGDHYAFYVNIQQSQKVVSSLPSGVWIGNGFTNPKMQVDACPIDRNDAGVVTSTDGRTIFAGILRQESPQALLPSEVVAWRNGRLVWNAQIPACQGSTDPQRRLKKMIRAQDGDIYLIAAGNEYVSGCNDMLVGIESESGSIKFQKSLNGSNSSVTQARVWSYDDELHGPSLVVYTNDYKLRYFDYQGVERTIQEYQFMQGISGTEAFLGQDGRVYQRPYQGDLCPGGIEQNVNFHDPGGQSGSLDFTTADRCTTGNNAMTVPLAGGATVTLNNGADVIYHDINGNEMNRLTLPHANGFSVDSFQFSMVADKTGGLYITRHIKKNNGQRHVIVQHLDNSGVVQDVFSSQTVNPSDPYPYYQLRSNVTLDDGYLYLAICHQACSSSNAAYVHKVYVGKEEYVYDGSVEESDDRTKFVAMGDSFSSGQGNAPFEPWTDRSEINTCHRSVSDAYPRQFALLWTNNVRLTDFVACSGATTQNILNGQHDEPAQIDALSDLTQKISVTVGGNDIGFEDFAKECIIADCDNTTAIYTDTIDKIQFDLHSKLYQTYDQILNNAPSATVYVLGYPQVAPDPDNATIPVQCNYFQPLGMNTWGDARAARKIVDELNEVIGDAVNGVNSLNNTSRLEFIDPNNTVLDGFVGHDVCRGVDSYFHNVTTNDAISNRSKIFHPNVNGQLEYTRQLSEWSM